MLLRDVSMLVNLSRVIAYSVMRLFWHLCRLSPDCFDTTKPLLRWVILPASGSWASLSLNSRNWTSFCPMAVSNSPILKSTFEGYAMPPRARWFSHLHFESFQYCVTSPNRHSTWLFWSRNSSTSRGSSLSCPARLN